MLLSFEMSLKELIHFIFLTLHSQEQQQKKGTDGTEVETKPFKSSFKFRQSKRVRSSWVGSA